VLDTLGSRRREETRRSGSAPAIGFALHTLDADRPTAARHAEAALRFFMTSAMCDHRVVVSRQNATRGFTLPVGRSAAESGAFVERHWSLRASAPIGELARFAYGPGDVRSRASRTESIRTLRG
jgi:hypothetical protein